MAEITASTSDPFVSRPAIDVSHLPEHAFDWRSPVWWGNTLLMVIETTTIALLLVSYFYIRRNYTVFPPPKVDVFPPIYKTQPMLKWGTLNLVLMVVACVAQYVTNIAARNMRRAGVLIGLIVMTAFGAACCWVRWKEFQGVYFWWNDNAYASVVWMLLGTHLTYLLATALEFALMAAWIATHRLDEPHALDVTLAGIYWYWATVVFVVVYAVIYFGARVM